MASIRIVDTWLRSPASSPSHYRSVMVIAEKWAEQRVLMRAYADSRDQTRPTIVLHGEELAIGPAGLDINGSWGIHVAPTVDDSASRAQEIKAQLESAARRLAGSKGNPPRLTDEEPTFDLEPTANWGPGAPRVLPKRSDTQQHHPEVAFVAPAGAARIPAHQAATYMPQLQTAHHVPAAPAVAATTELRKTPRSRERSERSLRAAPIHRTALGYTSEHAEELIAQIRRGIMSAPATPGVTDKFGPRMTVDVLVSGPAGQAVVRTGWIYDPGSTAPRLTTIFVK